MRRLLLYLLQARTPLLASSIWIIMITTTCTVALAARPAAAFTPAGGGPWRGGAAAKIAPALVLGGRQQQRRRQGRMQLGFAVGRHRSAAAFQSTPRCRTTASATVFINNINRRTAGTSSSSSSSFCRRMYEIDVNSSNEYDYRENGIVSSTTATDSALLDDDDDDGGSGGDDDTIYALSSGSFATATAVAVVRITGPDAARLLQSLLGRRGTVPPPRRAALRKLYHPVTQQPLDQALVLYFCGPNSFTGQDLVELQCHGGRAVLEGIFDGLAAAMPHSSSGGSTAAVRVAEPGEFTRRAFAAGKLDVLQVEALADLLGSDTAAQREQALRQLDGALSSVYADWRAQLVAGLAHAEAVIDFGDDERLDDDAFYGGDGGDHDDGDGHGDGHGGNFAPEDALQAQQASVWGGVVDRMRALCASMQAQLSDRRRGELVREGVKIAIVGPPNAGKSSLFNLLAARDAAIVSNIAGTTRDVLEVSMNLGGVKCLLQDTAGMRSSTDDVIEQEGMKRALRAAADADLVVAMVDSAESREGLNILETFLENNADDDDDITDHSNDADSTLTRDHVLLVMNKADLKNEEHVEIAESGLASIRDRVGGLFEVSCLSQQGIDAFLDELTNRVAERVGSGGKDGDGGEANEGALITRARHRQHVEAAVEALERFDMLSQQGTMAVDMAAEELRLAASELGRITGAVDVEDVLDKLFSDFCIGK